MKTRFFIALLWVVSLLVVIAPHPIAAQDGDPDNAIVEALLAQLRGAYSNTATQTSYLVNTADTTTQTTSVRRFQSGTYLMDIQIFESYVNTQTFETSAEATVVEDGLAATFSMEITQIQGLGFEYVRQGTVLSSPQDTNDSVELDLQLVQSGSETYINTDATDVEFREGLPMGWRLLGTDETPILTNATVTNQQVSEAVDGLRFTANAAAMQNLLQVGLVNNIDILEDDEIEGQAVRRYRITFDGEAALTVLGLDYEQALADLGAAANQAVPNATPTINISYVVELAVAPDTNLIYEQTITLTIEGLFSSSINNAAYLLVQTNTKSYNGFGETYALQPLDEIVGG